MNRLPVFLEDRQPDTVAAAASAGPKVVGVISLFLWANVIIAARLIGLFT